jgi:hypothetical protein
VPLWSEDACCRFQSNWPRSGSKLGVGVWINRHSRQASFTNTNACRANVGNNRVSVEYLQSQLHRESRSNFPDYAGMLFYHITELGRWNSLKREVPDDNIESLVTLNGIVTDEPVKVKNWDCCTLKIDTDPCQICCRFKAAEKHSNIFEVLPKPVKYLQTHSSLGPILTFGSLNEMRHQPRPKSLWFTKLKQWLFGIAS